MWRSPETLRVSAPPAEAYPAQRMAGNKFITAAGLIVLAGCAPELASKPGAYSVSEQPVEVAGHKFDLRYVRPVEERHPGYLVVFATGDAGWWGTSHELFEHLAERGYLVAGFNAPQILEPITRSGERVSTADAAKGLAQAYALVKRDLGLPDSTP